MLFGALPTMLICLYEHTRVKHNVSIEHNYVLKKVPQSRYVKSIKCCWRRLTGRGARYAERVYMIILCAARVETRASYYTFSGFHCILYSWWMY